MEYKLNLEAYAWAVENLGDNNNETQRLTDCLAAPCIDIGNAKEALKYAQKNQILCIKLYGKNSRDAMESYVKIAQCYNDLGNYRAAEATVKKVMDNYKNLSDELEIYMFLKACDVYFQICKHLEKIDTMLELSEKVIQICIIGGETSGYSFYIENAYDAKAFALNYIGKYNEAIEAEKQCIAHSIKLYGENHPYTLNSENYLSNLYCDAGRYDEALKLSRKLVKLHDELKLTYPDLYSKKLTLAEILTEKNEYDKAEKLFSEIKSLIDEENDNYGSAGFDFAYAKLCRKKENNTLSLGYAKKSLEKYSEFFDENSSDIKKIKEFIENMKEDIKNETCKNCL